MPNLVCNIIDDIQKKKKIIQIQKKKIHVAFEYTSFTQPVVPHVNLILNEICVSSLFTWITRGIFLWISRYFMFGTIVWDVMIIQLVNKTKLCLFIIDKLVVLVNIDIIKHQKKKKKINKTRFRIFRTKQVFW